MTRKSIDLTTLPGWSALSSGSHSITIVAKADGYKDSEPSAAVSVEKGAEEYIDCITFTGESSDFTLSVGGAKEWDGTVEYSTDHNTWTVWDGSEISSSSQKLYLRGSGNTTFYTSNGVQFVLSARVACSGNIQTLLEYSNPPAAVANSCYRNMFRGCTNLTQAPALPATTLASNCYETMFYNCTSLTTAPALPATTLAESCYRGMFRGAGLTTAPALPATTLANACYLFMFSTCTALTTAPALPATTLAESCYFQMFLNCTALTTIPALPATTMVQSCYGSMFSGCTEIKMSTTKTSEYPNEYRIPTSGTLIGFSDPGPAMFTNTGGTYADGLKTSQSYYQFYTSNAIV